MRRWPAFPIQEEYFYNPYDMRTIFNFHKGPHKVRRVLTDKDVAMGRKIDQHNAIDELLRLESNASVAMGFSPLGNVMGL